MPGPSQRIPKGSLGERLIERPLSDLEVEGVRRLEWARTHMPVLAAVRRDLKRSKALEGVRIGMALHVEAKTGVLALTLREVGATVRLASCNPLSSDDRVVLALRDHHGLDVYAKKGETTEEYYDNLHKVLDGKPRIVIDDGADLVHLLHKDRTDLLGDIVGGNEETTTGVIRLRAMAQAGRLRFPMVDVNDARMKRFFDNRYGTGQSTVDGILAATNLLLAGKVFVVAGYGWCGRGIAMRARGMGAQVVVTEIDPVKAIEARMDGFEVSRMERAARVADFIVSATGVKDVVAARHLRVLKDGCVLANAGHFDNEISKGDLRKAAVSQRRAREFVEEFTLRDGRKVYLLAEGRLVNLAAGQGHPAEIMDMSFSIQALCAAYVAEHGRDLAADVHPVPPSIDDRVARLAIEARGIEIDTLSRSQAKYLQGWGEGT